jgi:DUF971 family protein
MKTKEELRLLIKEIDKELDNTLKGNVLHEEQADYNVDYSKFEVIDADLTPKQNYELHMALKDVEDGNVYSWDDYLAIQAEWKSK